MSAAIVVPREYGVPLPRLDEMPADTAQMISAYREHPAGAFALRLFREDRPTRRTRT